MLRIRCLVCERSEEFSAVVPGLVFDALGRAGWSTDHERMVRPSESIEGCCSTCAAHTD